MALPSATASPWPARAAYVSAAIFVAASGGTNVSYGWAKGSDPITSTIWAAVAGGVAIVFALSWPALIRSVEARRWSAALMALAALLLAGGYSVTAALGSAAGGRMNAAATETAVTGTQARAQAAYNTAKADLDKLAPARATGELEALLAAAQLNPRTKGCAGDGSSPRVTCPKLEAELARARQRDKLQAAVDKASEALNAGPAKVANSDAKALARYLAAAGLDVGADRLNDLLVLLSVLMIEAGGGLSLALGMSLSAPPAEPTSAAAPAPEQRQKTLPARTPSAQPKTPSARSTERPTITGRSPERHRALAARPASSVLDWLADQGGRALTTQRALARALDRSPSAIHDELHRLAASGAITLASGPRGTSLVLRPN
jgi:hypothetical protein